MSTVVLLILTGFGLGAMYFLIASGLSLIYGLMGVLNFAHGAFLTVGSYATWYTETKLGGISVAPRFVLAALVGLAVGTVFAALVELVLIRPLYGRHIEQVLVTVGLALCVTALASAIWTSDAKFVSLPQWTSKTTGVLGASIPNDRWLEIATAAVVLFALQLFLRRTRYGLIVRAGVENRAMVTALGIDVRRAFTLVFAIGGLAAALAGVLSALYFGTVDQQRGTSLLLFGYTGLLSFGHALYFAVGVYVAGIAMTRWHWGFWPAVLFTAALGIVLPLVFGAVSLRVGGIAFAMVTLAFAQAGSVLAFKNPYRWTGGEDGFGVDHTKLPSGLVGILNTKNLYWLALAYALGVFLAGP